MVTRFATPEEIAHWNDLIVANPDGGNIFQTVEMAKLKSNQGWKPRFVIVDLCAITIHERIIPGLGKLWYLPKGPGVTTIADLARVRSSLKEFARSKGVFLIKVESEIPKTSSNTQSLKRKGFIAAHSIQPNSSTVILDLSPSIDEVMTALPQKSRHAIKRAGRDGISIKQVSPTEKNFTTMLSLMRETMEGKSMFLREDTYYRQFWKIYCDHDLGALFIAYNGKKPIAGAFVLTLGTKATYKDGGSTRVKSIYGASHALQWHIIEWLKTRNITSYDLCGAPPAQEINNKDHHLYGVGLFKTSFNKQITEFVGVYDVVVRPLAYRVWVKLGERVLTRFYFQFLKKYFY